MSDLEARFREAAERAQSLPRRPDNAMLLRLYGLYKQATVGDVQGARPGLLDPAGRAKFDAWAARAGLPRDAAREEYIALVESLEHAQRSA